MVFILMQKPVLSSSLASFPPQARNIIVSLKPISSATYGVAELLKKSFILGNGQSLNFEYGTGALLIYRSGINSALGLCLLPQSGSDINHIVNAPGQGSYYSISASNGLITIKNLYTEQIGFSLNFISLN